MSIKTTLHPKDYAIGETEKFYTEMAAKGWHLKRHGAWLSDFEQGEPMDMKYRVEVLVPKGIGIIKMPDEQKAVFEDCGWEYVDGHGYISVFRAPADSETEEFYIDPAQQADTLKSLRKQMLTDIIYFPLYIIVTLLIKMLMGENMPAQLHLIWIKAPQFLISIGVIAVAFSFDGLVGAYHINKLYKQMKNGIPLDHSPKKTMRLPAAIKYTAILLGFAVMYASTFEENIPMPLTSDGGYVTLYDLGVDVPTGNQSWLRSIGFSKTKSVFCDYWYVKEEVNNTDFEILTWMYQDVFQFKNENKALKTAKALMNTSTFAQAEDNFEEIEFAGLDKVYYNQDLELIVINNEYVGYFRSIFTEESRNTLLEVLRDKWI